MEDEDVAHYCVNCLTSNYFRSTFKAHNYARLNKGLMGQIKVWWIVETLFNCLWQYNVQ